MISPISTNRGTAVSVKALIVFHTMSPSVGHNCVPDVTVMPTSPTRLMVATTGTPHTRHSPRRPQYNVSATGHVMRSGQAHVDFLAVAARRQAAQTARDLLDVGEAQERVADGHDRLRPEERRGRRLDRA